MLAPSGVVKISELGPSVPALIDTIEAFSGGAGDFVVGVANWRHVRAVAEGRAQAGEELPTEEEVLSRILGEHLGLLGNLTGRSGTGHEPERLLKHVAPEDRYAAESAMLMLLRHSPFTDQELMWLHDELMTVSRIGYHRDDFLTYLDEYRPETEHIVDRYRGWLLAAENRTDSESWLGEGAALSLKAAEDLHRVGVPLIADVYVPYDDLPSSGPDPS